MEEIIKPRRRLGTGHFDRKLIERMVELSVADNYEEASKEWVATGNVYWGSMELPDWWESPNACLCGHSIVYHFEVQNSENGNMIMVGSDHINSYQILRQIKLSTGLAESMITDEMIDEWLKVRVKAMKSTAWWDTYGDLFTEMFDAIKEYDVRVNVNVKKWQYSYEHGKSLPVTTIRKGSSGKNTDGDYRMASIVWRWNHPDNPKAQIETRGYPTDKLWTDLIIFHSRIEQHKSKIDEEDNLLERAKTLTAKRKELRNAQLNLLAEDKEAKRKELFTEMCNYYGIPNYWDDTSMFGELSKWETTYLSDIKRRLSQGIELSDKQLSIFKRGVGSETPATEKQKVFLTNLWEELIKAGKEHGLEPPTRPDIENLSKKEASVLITKLKEEFMRQQEKREGENDEKEGL